MRRRISLLLAAMLAGTTMLFGPAQPASSVQLCTVVGGNVTVTPGLLWPVLLGLGAIPAPGKDHAIDVLIGNQANTIHGFTGNFGVAGTCVHVDGSPALDPLVVNGSLLGFCGHSTGTGTINGETFAYVSAGGLLILTGGVVGTATAAPVPLTGSCWHVSTSAPFGPTTTFALPGGATQFLVGGVGVGLNCSATTTVTNTLLGTHTLLLTQPFGIHTGWLAHATVRLCTAPNLLL